MDKREEKEGKQRNTLPYLTLSIGIYTQRSFSSARLGTDGHGEIDSRGSEKGKRKEVYSMNVLVLFRE